MVSERERVIAEAKSWIGTRYHTMARVKGAGVDCLMFLAEVYERAGVIPHVEIPYYPQDWHLHRHDERLMDGVLKFAHPVETPKPGDIALWKFGRAFAHSAIVIEWPALVIHAVKPVGVVMDRADMAGLRFDRSGPREVRFFSPWNE